MEAKLAAAQQIGQKTGLPTDDAFVDFNADKTPAKRESYLPVSF
jgi:hypothetical protein